MKDLLWNGQFEEQCLVLEIWLSNISLSLRVDVTPRLSWENFLGSTRSSIKVPTGACFRLLSIS
jgi:hypothetical protein